MESESFFLSSLLRARRRLEIRDEMVFPPPRPLPAPPSTQGGAAAGATLRSYWPS